MRLRYSSLVLKGTVVMHDQAATAVTQKFIMVDDVTYVPGYAYGTPYFVCSLKRADYMDIYELSQGLREPQSIVEFFMLRRKWTPYGYAKVWGRTKYCAPPPHRQPSKVNIQRMMDEQQRKQARCADWYRQYRGTWVELPRDQSYVKHVNRMYRNMLLGDGPAESVALPKTAATLAEMRGDE